MSPCGRVRLVTVAAGALFASNVQQSQSPDPAEVRRALVESLRLYGWGGCAAHLAQEYGEHPDEAAQRMCWCRTVVAETYAIGAGS